MQMNKLMFEEKHTKQNSTSSKNSVKITYDVSLVNDRTKKSPCEIVITTVNSTRSEDDSSATFKLWKQISRRIIAEQAQHNVRDLIAFFHGIVSLWSGERLNFSVDNINSFH